MKTMIIGSGNMAEALATALAEKRSGCKVVLEGVAARDRTRGTALAKRCGTRFVPLSGGTALPEADLYVLAVSDRAVKGLSEKLDFPAGATVAHTGGCIPLSELSENIEHRAVMYPLQTFSKGVHIDFSEVPVFTEASDPQAAEAISRLANVLSAHMVEIDSDRRAVLHLAGAVACNLVNALYAGAARIANNAGFRFDVLAPLITETARKAVGSGDPATIQTGAAVRGDEFILKRHAEILTEFQEDRLRDIYAKLSEEIWQISHKCGTSSENP